MTQKFYVYLHRRADNNEPFYVGKGSGYRAYRTSGRSVYWNRVKEKYGFKVEIVFSDLTEEESFDLEKSTIQELKYFGYRLVNLTSGGEGVSGIKITRSDEWRNKVRIANIGKKHKEETKAKISDSLRKSGTCNDTNVYVFYSDCDVFIGTRKEFRDTYNLHRRKIRTLFSKQRSSVVLGWSILSLQQLLIISNYQGIKKC